jgi:pimeloyl-ACP methyl ester carboxylesterase
MTTTRTTAAYGDLTLTFDEAGTGRPVLILHGGGGPATVAGLARHLSAAAHTLTAVLPGWDGTPRPAPGTAVADLAGGYLRHLRERGLRDVLVVGSSLGGWIGAETALQDDAGLVTGLVLIDAVGVHVEAEPIADVFMLDARGLAEHSWHRPERFLADPADLPPAELARRQANMAAMRALAGDPYMHDPTLLDRLGGVRAPTSLLWGESDRVVTPAYGAAYAKAFGGARFEVIAEAGHLPQIEQPDATYALVEAQLRRTGGAAASPAR